MPQPARGYHAISFAMSTSGTPAAIFDGPARAIRCATAITEYTSRLGVRTCTRLHTGECEIVDRQVAGAEAQMCLCVANEAEPGEILVSSTVKDLVAGSGISSKIVVFTRSRLAVSVDCLLSLEIVEYGSNLSVC